MSDLSPRLTAALSDRYRLERQIGAGGMATVYLAQDLRHDREVAIKVLHEELGAVLGAERFLAEIKTTAKLQHPHILPLLDSGEAGGLLFYVMPFIAGETLRARLERETQLPVADALRIAREVADALAEAHGRGVVHRDIKPENILLQGSHALVADFGIALAVQHAGGARMTQTGLSLGTPQYMAPEQAMGDKAVDHRADIYALGAVTYEMLTGEPPHTGANVQAIVAKLLTEPVRPVRILRPAVPEQVDATLQVALQKLPADRFATVAEFSEALRGGVMTERMSALLPASAPGAARGWGRVLAGGALLLAAGVTLGWLMSKGGGPRPPDLPLARVPLALPIEDLWMGAALATTISPDGSRLAVAALDSTGQVRTHVFRLADGVVTTLDIRGQGPPAFSPDGQWVVMQDNRSLGLSLEPATGGQARRLSGRVALAGGGTWLSDSVVAVSVGTTLQTLMIGSGRMDTLLSGGDSARWIQPHAAGDDRLLAVRVPATAIPSLASAGEIGVVSMSSRRFTPLGLEGVRPHLVAPDILTFLREGAVWGVMVDPRTLQPRGTPVIIAGPDAIDRVVNYSVSRNGLMLVRRGGDERERELVLVDRRGTARLARTERIAYRSVRFSPNGERLAFTRATTATLGGDVYVLTLASGALLRLTRDSANLAPEWSPDGRAIYYARIGALTGRPPEIMRVPATGGGTPTTLLTRPSQIYEFQVAPDSRRLLWREDAINAGTGRDILMAPIDSGGEPRGLRVTADDERGVALSPDGAWYLYAARETGITEIYVARVDGDGARWAVSVGGGTEPRWARNGEVFYRAGDSVMGTRLTLGEEPRAQPPRALFVGQYYSLGHEAVWDVSPDGQQFAFVRTFERARSSLELVLNWTGLVRAAPR